MPLVSLETQFCRPVRRADYFRPGRANFDRAWQAVSLSPPGLTGLPEKTRPSGQPPTGTAGPIAT